MTEKPTTALAKVEKTIGDLLGSDQAASQIKLALSKAVTPERFFRVCATAMNRVPKLKDCTTASLAESMMDLAQMGLVPDGRHAHLIPYGKECKMIVDWKGYVNLARQSGEISIWRPELVCINDKFVYDKSRVQLHEINFKEPRGGVYAVYSYVLFKDGSEDYEVMTMEEVEAIKDRSAAGNKGPWKTDFREMTKKTVMRRHAKRLPLGGEFQQALEADYDSAIDITGSVVAQEPIMETVEEDGDPKDYEAPEPQATKPKKDKKVSKLEKGEVTQPDVPPGPPDDENEPFPE